ncbi:transmembrane protein 256 homolog isoform X1 [Orussus abietinus]|uniref:transmembrane protein 256 homolog isoform X1 n=1 Tax=Orussus abietinus TaxID=222816 RepID=UPI0006269EC6|nr:transmembrane protein 256 homolog isoform X1 [Orussus abietinus]
MGVQDIISYTLFTNPISSGAYSYAKTASIAVRDYIGLQPRVQVKMVTPDPVPLWKLAAASGPFIRLAAISGTAAIILGATGTHRKYPDEKGQDQKEVFKTASFYHFVHTLALMGLPLCRAPYIAGTFMVSGIVLFCGSCYYYAFTGDKRFSRFTPIGGTCFILGWLGMIF